MVRAFYEQNCAMVVGTYMMTDFNMNMIAPGIIDHKEWTPANGRNNALRINGLGAPRAFYTPVLREVKVPNTSYGEDYALGLNFSRQYQIGRVYDVVYLCRRWDDNSDASTGYCKNERTQPLQRPYPYLGTPSTHSNEQEKVIAHRKSSNNRQAHESNDTQSSNRTTGILGDGTQQLCCPLRCAGERAECKRHTL